MWISEWGICGLFGGCSPEPDVGIYCSVVLLFIYVFIFYKGLYLFSTIHAFQWHIFQSVIILEYHQTMKNGSLNICVLSTFSVSPVFMETIFLMLKHMINPFEGKVYFSE